MATHDTPLSLTPRHPSLLGGHITEHIQLLPDISGMCFFLSDRVVETREFDRHTGAWHRSLSYGRRAARI